MPPELNVEDVQISSMLSIRGTQSWGTEAVSP